MDDRHALERLRVSVATYNQLVFPHPENGKPMLALERKAWILNDGRICVLAQPFGGGVRIIESRSLEGLLESIEFDSERSARDQDFRILIPPFRWGAVKEYCLLHLGNPHDPEIESTPDRELVEEFAETMGVELKRHQYTVEPMGFVIEERPVQTENAHARGFPTTRLYRTFKVVILDARLCQNLVETSQGISDEELGKRLLGHGIQRANTVLALPLEKVRKSFLAIPPEKRFNKIAVDHQLLDESVLAILEDIEVPQYRRYANI